MIVGYVEPSGEHAELARREVAGAVEALGGRLGEISHASVDGLLAVVVPTEATLAQLADRLALARRTLIALTGPGTALDTARREGRAGRRAAFRRLGRPGSSPDAEVRAAGEAYVLGGGAIDLGRPEQRYWLGRTADGGDLLLREVAAVERARTALRALPQLPFRRPVALAPRLARAAVNLAAVRPGDRVLDPFLGTGALLAEAALLGARVYGLDADPAMVRGALRNFAHLGVEAVAFAEGDARTVAIPDAPVTFDAIVTDPPYGRSSASVGAGPSQLVPEVLDHWQAAVRPGGTVVVLSPGGPPSMGPPWAEEFRVAVRVHRSLTREFRRYRRSPTVASD